MADLINIEDIIAREGRFTARAQGRWPTVSVAHVDFDTLFGVLHTALFGTLLHHEPFLRQYTGTHEEIRNQVDHDVDHLCHQALNELWNRLRTISETLSSATRLGVFLRKAPSVDGFMFPRFLASLLSSIGPIRISDTLRETTVIYAPAAATAQHFGRLVATPVDYLAVNRVQRALRETTLPLASIQGRGSTGSYFTTAFTQYVEPNRFEVIGYLHYSHYTRNDVVMAMLFSDPIDDENPFEDLSITIGFATSDALLAAYRALEEPAADITADGPPRHVGADFSINRFGIAPASEVPTPGRGEGIYVLGRGTNRELCSSLARDLTQQEIDAVLRYRILHNEALPAPRPEEILGANIPPPPGP